ncbi:uncharacterized protein LOC118644593 isoform X1 [Monomorium pharaonis]|uniref:uncharacterized protein LOC118644593 isoform X1 n=1 Tax=Monomorium pharaonis TaxID=307658 RepID=UPI001747913D|nr:uncharacterized protein LOC118644593 isoform X1 [Monomorium pharaonis]XP_036139321.1 uncharacterized protein LOC118644593 isoform X1 [Monomorium pharaonis]
MTFLRDSCLLKTTVSNIKESSDFEDNSIENIEPNCGLRNKKKKSNLETSTSAIEKIANSLCDNNDLPINLPPPPVPDEIDAFLSMLGCQLRELQLRKRREIMKKFLDIIYDALAEHT